MQIPSGQLPGEDRTDWQAGVEAALRDARAPFDLLREWLCRGRIKWSVAHAPKPVNDDVMRLVGLLAAKLLSAYRSMLILCERGHGVEALVLLRVVLESSAQIVWLCRHPMPPHAALMIAAHEQLRRGILFDSNGHPTYAAESRQKAQDYVDMIQSTGGTATLKALRKHWHGIEDGFEGLCTQLGWKQHYDFLYRIGSIPAHAADLSLHMAGDDGITTTVRLGPGPMLVDSCAFFGATILRQVIDAVKGALNPEGL